MQLKILLKRKPLIIILSGFAFSLGLVLLFTTSTTAFYKQEQLGVVGLPVRFKIPKIKVDAMVDYVGLTSGGAVDVPKGPSNVAWFDLGPRPGEEGSSIIDGHSGWKNNIQAVFDNLYKLKKGDKIYVQDDKGATISFVVRVIRTYNPKADASSVFNSIDGKAHLNLIACTGVWNAIEKTHSERLVVFADKE